MGKSCHYCGELDGDMLGTGEEQYCEAIMACRERMRVRLKMAIEQRDDALRRLTIESKRADAAERRCREAEESRTNWRGLYERTKGELERLLQSKNVQVIDRMIKSGATIKGE